VERLFRIVPAAVAAALIVACSTGTPRTTIVPDATAIGGTHFMPSRQNTSLIAFLRTSGSNNLIYGGGPVQRNAKIYLVFWQFERNDAYGEQQRFTTFIKGLHGSGWTSVLMQYHDRLGYISNYITYGGSWNDNTNSIPLQPTQAEVAAEATRAAEHFANYSPNALYVVALEKGKDPSGFGAQWCAFHSDTFANGHTITYEDFPYQTDAGLNCGENAFNPGVSGRLDGVTIVGGHETVEAITDPQPYSGWADHSGNEVADKCVWTNLQNTSFSTGTFPTQPLWSNAAGHCVQ
jgi:serine protease